MSRCAKRKRLSPYRRMEENLAYARRATVNAVNEYIEVRKALTDALAFLDRLQNTKDGGWNYADIKRLAEIRALAEKI
jgi:hypothetical protein